jgi:hypothetical protein
MHKFETVATHLRSGVVVDKARLNLLAVDKTAEALSTAYASGKPVIFVDRAELFFTARNLIAGIKGEFDNWNLIAEHFQITIADTDLQVINEAVSCIKRISLAVDSLKPQYPFMPIPDDWSVETHIKVGTQSIGRIKDHHLTGNTGGYKIGVRQAKKLWDIAGPSWFKSGFGSSSAGLADTTILADGGYTKNCVIYRSSIRAGCQTIQRFELEQVALQQGWPFPAA